MKPNHDVRVTSRFVPMLLLAWLCIAPVCQVHAQLSPEYLSAISYCSQGVSNQTLVLSDSLLSLSQLNSQNAPSDVPAGWVEMSVFIKSSDRAYYSVGGFSTFGGSTLWSFSPMQFQSFFQNTNRFATMLSGTNLVLRIDQLLGLSDTSPNSYIADIWVDPNTLLRPTPNPTLTNVTESWTFPSPLIDVPGKSGADYYTWFTNRVGTVFGGSGAFPWTSLGYTYDYGTNGHLAGETSYEGLSEFLMFRGAGTYQYYTSGIYTPDQFVELPEPGTTALFVMGAGLLLVMRRRCRRG